MEYESDRISSQDNSGTKGINSLPERASDEARRVLGAIQETAGTTYCKGIQINNLKKSAIDNGVWIDDTSTLGEFSDRGSGNEVYVDSRNEMVCKLNDFRYSDDNLTPFFDRIKAHNMLFPGCPYSLIGFAENRDGNICAVLSQPFIRADREATIEEITGALVLQGFMPQEDGEYFTNGEYDIFDALPNNILHDIDNLPYFIDTITYPTSADNFDTYKSLSPRYSE